MRTEAQVQEFLIQMSKRIRAANSDLISCLTQIAHDEGINVRFPLNRWGGIAFTSVGQIEVGLMMAKTESIMSTFFHEVCHVRCYRTKTFKAYHCIPSRASHAQRVAYLRTGLRAERHVDKMAKEMMASYFPGFRYVGSYRTKRDREILLDNLRGDVGF